MKHVEVQRVIEAPPQVVWDRYTDHESWTDWAGLGTVRLDRPGVPPPNGAGSVRAISSAGVKVFEEVIAFDPPRRMTYRVVKGGIPIKDHLGEVLFEPHERGTLVTWRCQFNSKVPGLGGAFRFLITRLFHNALRGLSRALAPAGT